MDKGKAVPRFVTAAMERSSDVNAAPTTGTLIAFPVTCRVSCMGEEFKLLGSTELKSDAGSKQHLQSRFQVNAL